MHWTSDENSASGMALIAPPQLKLSGRSRKNREPVCQVPGCGCDVSDLKDYHNRFRICEEHQKASCIVLGGVQQRFCQQCGRFQSLEDFDGSKRTCRVKLQQHNERRRISKLVKSSMAAHAPPPQPYLPERKAADSSDAYGSSSMDSYDTVEPCLFLDQTGPARAPPSNMRSLFTAPADAAMPVPPQGMKLRLPQQGKLLSMSSCSTNTSFPNFNSGASSPPSYDSSRSGSPQPTIFSASSSARLARHGFTLSGTSSTTIPSPNLSINSSFKASDSRRSPSPPTSYPSFQTSRRNASLHTQPPRHSSPTNGLLLRPNHPVLPLSHRSSQLPDVDLPPFSFEDLPGSLQIYGNQDLGSIPAESNSLFDLPQSYASASSAKAPSDNLLAALHLLVSSGLYPEHEAEELLNNLARTVFNRSPEQLTNEQLQELVWNMLECGSRQMEWDGLYDTGLLPMSTSDDMYDAQYLS